MNLEQEQYEISLTDRFKRHAQDFNDLQNEMAGNDVGRISRFFSGEDRGLKGAEKRRAKWEQTLSNLQIMMSDPEYAKLYRETENKLRESQSNLDTALDRVLDLKTDAEATLIETLDNAARLPDGRRVFRDQNGQILLENSHLIDDDLAATIIWDGSEPSFEEMQAQKDQLQRLTDLEADIHAGQAEIGEMQDRMANEDNPPSAEDMQIFQDQAADMVSGIEAELQGILDMDAPKDVGLDQTPTVVPEFTVPER